MSLRVYSNDVPIDMMRKTDPYKAIQSLVRELSLNRKGNHGSKLHLQLFGMLLSNEK